MAAKTLLDNIINLKIDLSSNISPLARTKNLIYLCKLKNKTITDNKFIEITDKKEIGKYTDDKFAYLAFDNGLNKIILAFIENEPDYSVLANYAYTLVFGEGVDKNTKVSGFDGIKVYSVSELNEENTKIANSQKCCVVLSQPTEGLAVAIFAKFLSQNNLTDMQYSDFNEFTPVLTNLGEIDNAREKGYTFIGNDKTTILAPVLLYFRAGNLPISSIYVAENLKQDIQIACFKLIKDSKLPYDDMSLSLLNMVGNKIIDNYINTGIISSAVFKIPPKEEQKEKDIIEGTINNVKTTVILNSSVWRLIGTIKTDY